MLELNASDTRGKKAIEQQLADVVLCHAMTGDGMTTKKRLVIMDEVNNHHSISRTVELDLSPLFTPFHICVLGRYCHITTSHSIFVPRWTAWVHPIEGVFPS